jgi:hypothetical protein
MLVSPDYHTTLTSAAKRLQRLLDGGWLKRPKRSLVVADSLPLPEAGARLPYVFLIQKSKSAKSLQLALPPGRPGSFMGDLAACALTHLDVSFSFSLTRGTLAEVPCAHLQTPRNWSDAHLPRPLVSALFLAAVTLADAEWETVTALAHRVHLAAVGRLAKLARAASNAISQCVADEVEETHRKGLRALRTTEQAERHALFSLLEISTDPAVRRLVETLSDQLATTEPLLPHILKQKAKERKAA